MAVKSTYTEAENVFQPTFTRQGNEIHTVGVTGPSPVSPTLPNHFGNSQLVAVFSYFRKVIRCFRPVPEWLAVLSCTFVQGRETSCEYVQKYVQNSPAKTQEAVRLLASQARRIIPKNFFCAESAASVGGFRHQTPFFLI